MWLLVIAAGSFGIAATTGAGWLLVLIAGLVGVFVVAALGPALALRGIQVSASGPRDATVGEPCPMTVSLAGRPTVCVVELGLGAGETSRPGRRGPSSPEARSARTPVRGTLPFVPRRRGLLETVSVTMMSAAPLGLVRWRRVTEVVLEEPTIVAPRPVFEVNPPDPTSEEGVAGGAETRGQELYRGVREYAQGDPPKLIHWPATARNRGLMVREVEAPARPTSIIVLDLREGDWADVELAASRTFGLVLDALDSGVGVVLGTCETHGPRLVPVTTRTGAGRRLALAVPGPAPSLSGQPRAGVTFVTSRPTAAEAPE